ncbi:unnamed protein product [Heligmosomoides polygyrus]|uniref:SLC12 domain-containing protein n=1 Tax=Heligmosomoides polygyrus TaxID=6339 RepID=A0A183FE35_HELPZ|nr:unnamed protein product [Heligmosomoides polygyrus]
MTDVRFVISTPNNRPRRSFSEIRDSAWTTLVKGPDILLILHTDDSEEEKGFVAEYREAPRGRIRPAPQLPKSVPNKEPISK